MNRHVVDSTDQRTLKSQHINNKKWYLVSCCSGLAESLGCMDVDTATIFFESYNHMRICNCFGCSGATE